MVVGFLHINLSGMTRNYQGRAESDRDTKLKADGRNNMKREDISKIFEGATDAQISALLDINSRDIGKAKADGEKLQTELTAAQDALKKANDTITQLEAHKGDVEKLQSEIDRYRQADADRAEAERQAAARAELEERFNAVTGDRKFIHEFVRKGVMEDFGKALADKANRGKSDAEVFSALTKDQDYFASQNPAAENMAQFGNVNPDNSVMAAVRAAMGLPNK